MNTYLLGSTQKKKKCLAAVVSFFVIFFLFLLFSPQHTYAKGKGTEYYYMTTPTYMVYGDKHQINIEAVKKYFKLKGKKCKVKCYVNSSSHLKINKKGIVTVKKPDKTCKNFRLESAYVEFTYNGKKYVFVDKFYIAYAFDDDNPDSVNDITKEQIKRFRKAYQTGNTKKLLKGEKKIYKRAKEAVDYASVGSNRYEKLKRLNDWLTDNIIYDCMGENEDRYSIKGALVDGRAVCNGYANAFKMCALMLGIPCEMVIGYPRAVNIVSHAWNIVKLEDGNWYHIDTTYNDVEEDDVNELVPCTYNYFCLNDEQLKGTHAWYETKKCKGTKYTIANYEREYFVDSRDELYGAIRRAVSEEKTQFVVYMNCWEGNEDNYFSPFYVNNVFASLVAGRNIEVKNIEAEDQSLYRNYTVNPNICPNNEVHTMHMFTINYLSDSEVEPLKFVRSAQEIEALLKDAVEKRKTLIKNVALPEGVFADGFEAPEIIYSLFRRNIFIGIGSGIGILPSQLNPDGKSYEIFDIAIDYSEENSKVYEVANKDDVQAALDEAIANHWEMIYFYAPNYPKDELVWITAEYTYDISLVDNIYGQTSNYNFIDPYTGMECTPYWVEVKITYK